MIILLEGLCSNRISGAKTLYSTGRIIITGHNMQGAWDKEIIKQWFDKKKPSGGEFLLHMKHNKKRTDQKKMLFVLAHLVIDYFNRDPLLW